ncbi:MAG: 2-oxo acid dehydrogenase subunit E2 [Acidobacteriaceae bacterium]|nr:2-oxo acid dehydrogenase subunit E2 [Acidobacteriaceae bacterium]
MATVDIRMFADQNEGTESFVGVWLKKPGERVMENDPIVEISTDKVSMEVPSPASGLLKEILKPEGEPAAPGEVLGRIETEHGETAGAIEDGLSPAVRRLLQQHGLDLNDVTRTITGTGRGGRITHEDVTAYLARTQPVSETKPLSRMVPHTAMRRSIAAHMLRSVQTAPHVTAVFEADLSRVLAHREQFRTGRGESVPSVTAYLIAAAAKALQAVPEVNSRWHEEALEIFEDANIGIGTATENGGLIVPVLKRAQTMALTDIASKLRELTERARRGTLTAGDLEGGTFTISNHGVSGSLTAAPIILANGQAAILGAGKLQKRPLAIELDGRDAIQVRPMMYVTLTVDHRALDAQQTNAFMTKFVDTLEKWS